MRSASRECELWLGRLWLDVGGRVEGQTVVLEVGGRVVGTLRAACRSVGVEARRVRGGRPGRHGWRLSPDHAAWEGESAEAVLGYFASGV